MKHLSIGIGCLLLLFILMRVGASIGVFSDAICTPESTPAETVLGLLTFLLCISLASYCSENDF